jgi:nucleotide-binding universal stress UspA family protein
MRDAFGGRSRSGQAELAGLAALDLDGDRQRSILVAVDGNESSLRAAAYAIGLARRRGLRLVVLYVHTIGPLASTADSIQAMRLANAEAVSALRMEMDDQAASLGVDIAVVERSGSRYLETIRLAGQLRVDAIVMAGGRSFGHRFFGLPVSRIVRDAQCPVTVVP